MKNTGMLGSVGCRSFKQLGLDYEDDYEDEEEFAPGKGFDLGKCQL